MTPQKCLYVCVVGGQVPVLVSGGLTIPVSVHMVMVAHMIVGSPWSVVLRLCVSVHAYVHVVWQHGHCVSAAALCNVSCVQPGGDACT